MILRALALVLLLNGCAVLSDHRVVAGCQVADGLTTYYALTHGATEANPLLAGLGPGGILLFKVILAYALWDYFKPPEGRELDGDMKFAAGTVALLGCLPAASNLNVIKGLPK